MNNKKNGEGSIATYSVNYKGGHPDYPKSKAGKIIFKLFEDHFEFAPTLGSKRWFEGLVIPFDSTFSLEIAERIVSTFESIVGGLDSRQLNQANNIHIKYEDFNHNELIIRFGMLSGISVMGQAKKCRELEDKLKIHGINKKFKDTLSSSKQLNTNDIITKIEKISSLHDKGIISSEEFEEKKSELLSRI